jgi:hypothetical protein
MSMSKKTNTKVFIEKSDGTILILDGANIKVSMLYDYKNSFNFRIDGVSTNGILEQSDIKEKRTAQKWRCTYCGHINQRKDETCILCGGVRSFLYG